MKRVESIEDQVRDVVTYELDDGRRVTLAGDAVRRFGATSLLRGMGVQIESGPIPVHQSGRMVGLLPADFDPALARSASPLYDIRPGDYARDGDRWVASPILGEGDLLATPGFKPA